MTRGRKPSVSSLLPARAAQAQILSTGEAGTPASRQRTIAGRARYARPYGQGRRAGANSIHLGSGHARASSANHRGTDTQCAPLRAEVPRRRKFHPLGKQACPYLVRRTIAGRACNARPCIFHHASVRYCCGSTFSSFTCTSKCRCGPVELPVLPESAICSPLATISPTATSSSELCAYSVL